MIFAAYCLMDASILGYGFMRGHVQELLEKGLLDTERFIARSRPEEVFQPSRVEDIEALAQTQPVERLHGGHRPGHAVYARLRGRHG